MAGKYLLQCVTLGWNLPEQKDSSLKSKRDTSIWHMNERQWNLPSFSHVYTSWKELNFFKLLYKWNTMFLLNIFLSNMMLTKKEALILILIILSKGICQLGNCSAWSLVMWLHVLYESAVAFLPSSVLDQMFKFHPRQDLCLWFLVFIAETTVFDFLLITERH